MMSWVAWDVALNPRTPTDILRQLALSTGPWVAALAAERLQ